LLSAVSGAQDIVVRSAARQRRRQLQIEQLGLKEEPSGGRLRDAAAGRNGADQKPRVDLVLVRPGHELIEKPTDLANVARHLGQALLPVIEFFEHDHRQEDVVLLKPKDGRGVVHQHVGVEDEEAGLVVFAFDHGIGYRSAAPEHSAAALDRVEERICASRQGLLGFGPGRRAASGPTSVRRGYEMPRPPFGCEWPGHREARPNRR